MSVQHRDSLRHHLQVIFTHLDEKKILSIMHTCDGTTVHIRRPCGVVTEIAGEESADWNFVHTHLEHIEDRETDTTFHPNHRWKGEKNLFGLWVEYK